MDLLLFFGFIGNKIYYKTKTLREDRTAGRMKICRSCGLAQAGECRKRDSFV